jgi:ADP-ribose pyrophosphatase
VFLEIMLVRDRGLSEMASNGSLPRPIRKWRPAGRLAIALDPDTIEPVYQSSRAEYAMNEPTIHYRGRYLNLVEVERWEYASRNNASAVVVIVGVTQDGEIVLIEQYRRPVDARVIELPAGLVGDEVDPDETIIEAAARELHEETGFEATRIEPIMDCPSSAGMTDEVVSFVRATGLRRTGPGGGDHSEDIEVHLVSLGEADAWLRRRQAEGTPLDPKVFAALHWLNNGTA